jgi:hypothetical protein
MKPPMNSVAPIAALMMMNWRFDQLNPACEMRIGSGRFFIFFWRSSSSLIDSSTCSRRTLGPRPLVAATRAGSARVTLCWRCSTRRSPERIG